jgi:hypothetical protein
MDPLTPNQPLLCLDYLNSWLDVEELVSHIPISKSILVQNKTNSSFR